MRSENIIQLKICRGLEAAGRGDKSQGSGYAGTEQEKVKKVSVYTDLK